MSYYRKIHQNFLRAFKQTFYGKFSIFFQKIKWKLILRKYVKQHKNLCWQIERKIQFSRFIEILLDHGDGNCNIRFDFEIWKFKFSSNKWFFFVKVFGRKQNLHPIYQIYHTFASDRMKHVSHNLLYQKPYIRQFF